MKISVLWKDKMLFEGQSGDLKVPMDAKAPIGKGEGFTPKELMAIGLAGCTAMDVIALMRKHKQEVESFEVKANLEESTGGHPMVYTKALLNFELKGNIDKEKLAEAVKLSQTQYCGVSAMLSKSMPIEYKVTLNGEEISTGEANFRGQ